MSFTSTWCIAEHFEQLNFYLTWLKQSLIKIQEVQVDAIDIQLMLYLNDTDVLHEVHLAV